jgi:ABC-type taurine transport system ATPase subunit
MLTRLTVRNFKRFDEAEIPLGESVVFVGPNNSGKTTALQALALWDLGLRRWREKRQDKGTPGKRPGVAINRRDILSIPMPSANLMWRDLHTRSVSRVNGKPYTSNIRIEVCVESEAEGRQWRCGLEFDFANQESLFCRPLREGSDRMPIPSEAHAVKVAYLPPMSGLAANETKLTPGAIDVRVGEGRTADVLRNLCAAVDESGGDRWKRVVEGIERLFGVALERPEYIAERGEIELRYRNAGGVILDLSCAGRGLQQTLLLLAYLELNPGAVLLLDEPDAHLEILRQREIYRELTDRARASGGQVLMASHSEALMDEAESTRDHSVVAFLGRPHLMLRDTPVRHSLRQIGYQQYYLAEQAGWVLYLEGRTDLHILRAFAERLRHPAAKALERPFLESVGNQPNKGREHFDALLEAKPDLVGFLLVDQDAKGLQARPELVERQWRRREIENYICQPETLLRLAAEIGRRGTAGTLFEEAAVKDSVDAMRDSINDYVAPARLHDDSWWHSMKASDEFLAPVLAAFYRRLKRRCEITKADYHELVPHVPDVDPEVVSVLDGIHEVASRARPVA